MKRGHDHFMAEMLRVDLESVRRYEVGRRAHIVRRKATRPDIQWQGTALAGRR